MKQMSEVVQEYNGPSKACKFTPRLPAERQGKYLTWLRLGGW